MGPEHPAHYSESDTYKPMTQAEPLFIQEVERDWNPCAGSQKTLGRLLVSRPILLGPKPRPDI